MREIVNLRKTVRERVGGERDDERERERETTYTTYICTYMCILRPFFLLSGFQLNNETAALLRPEFSSDLNSGIIIEVLLYFVSTNQNVSCVSQPSPLHQPQRKTVH